MSDEQTSLELVAAPVVNTEASKEIRHRRDGRCDLCAQVLKSAPNAVPINGRFWIRSLHDKLLSCWSINVHFFSKLSASADLDLGRLLRY